MQQTVTRVFSYFTLKSFDFHSSLPMDADFDPVAYVDTVFCWGGLCGVLDGCGTGCRRAEAAECRR